jgi:excinuclease UvrABC ATPase subunit
MQILSPLIRNEKGTQAETLAKIRQQGLKDFALTACFYGLMKCPN